MADKVVPVRLPDALRARVDAYRERVRKTTGFNLTQSQVVRRLIECGLDAVEAEAAHPTRRK